MGEVESGWRRVLEIFADIKLRFWMLFGGYLGVAIAYGFAESLAAFLGFFCAAGAAMSAGLYEKQVRAAEAWSAMIEAIYIEPMRAQQAADQTRAAKAP